MRPSGSAALRQDRAAAAGPAARRRWRWCTTRARCRSPPTSSRAWTSSSCSSWAGACPPGSRSPSRRLHEVLEKLAAVLEACSRHRGTAGSAPRDGPASKLALPTCSYNWPWPFSGGPPPSGPTWSWPSGCWPCPTPGIDGGLRGALPSRRGHRRPGRRPDDGAVPQLGSQLRPAAARAPPTCATRWPASLAALERRLEEAVFLGLHRRCREHGGADGCRRQARGPSPGGCWRRCPRSARCWSRTWRRPSTAIPAATGPEEVIACYPGLYAIAIYRVAHRLLREGGGDRAAHADRTRQVAHRHRHPPGRHHRLVVLHRSRHRHRHRRDHRHRQLGAHLPGRDPGRAVDQAPQRQPRRQAAGAAKRHPTIEDEVIIYANATILGGDTVIGRGAIIGGNSFITYSVPPGHPGGGGAVDGGARGLARRPNRWSTLLREASAEILDAQRPIRVLRSLAWTRGGRGGVLRRRGRASCPGPSYRVSPEVAPALERLRALQARLTGDNEVERFLRDTAGSAGHRRAHVAGGGQQGLLLPLGRAVRPAGQPVVRPPHHQPGAGPALRPGGGGLRAAARRGRPCPASAPRRRCRC